MRIGTQHGVSLLATLLGMAPTVAFSVDVAPDPTPLLPDRLGSFAHVVVALVDPAAPAEAVAGTNCVALPFQVRSVLKGGLTRDARCAVEVHEGLPPLLAERDKKAPRGYLLVLQGDEPRFTLGGAMLFEDLARFIPADAGLEKVVRALIEPADSTATLLKTGVDLLADQDVAASPVATQHVHEVLTRRIAEAFPDEWRKVEEQTLRGLADRAGEQIRAGRAMETAPALVLALDARPDNPAGLACADPSLAAPLRRWLRAEAAAPQVAWRPDVMRSAGMKSAVLVLARLEDRKSTDLFRKLAADRRWPEVQAAARAALGEAAPPPRPPALIVPRL